MLYKIYGENYFKGWELITAVYSQDDVDMIIDNIDAHVYNAYMVIKRENKTDEIIDFGLIDRPYTLYIK